MCHHKDHQALGAVRETTAAGCLRRNFLIARHSRYGSFFSDRFGSFTSVVAQPKTTRK